MNRVEKEQLEKGNLKGCPVCGSKKSEDVGKWITPIGACGDNKELYYCKKCGVVRIWL